MNFLSGLKVTGAWHQALECARCCSDGMKPTTSTWTPISSAGRRLRVVISTLNDSPTTLLDAVVTRGASGIPSYGPPRRLFRFQADSMSKLQQRAYEQRAGDFLPGLSPRFRPRPQGTPGAEADQGAGRLGLAPAHIGRRSSFRNRTRSNVTLDRRKSRRQKAGRFGRSSTGSCAQCADRPAFQSQRRPQVDAE